MAPINAYNLLPSLGEAVAGFVDRDILTKLMPLFAAYQNFAVCLVHRHCTLEEGEHMVSTGAITQPEREGQMFPSSWLATGEPFEFNREQTPAYRRNCWISSRRSLVKRTPPMVWRCLAFVGLKLRGGPTKYQWRGQTGGGALSRGRKPTKFMVKNTLYPQVGCPPTSFKAPTSSYRGLSIAVWPPSSPPPPDTHEQIVNRTEDRKLPSFTNIWATLNSQLS
ncbi:hypothetical protein B0H34DRAFT_793266 [Crassisporium funariophilum]|nr:hypothetical protein B0H34DRAFT_793266 [Crassisporium funariophilum]